MLPGAERLKKKLKSSLQRVTPYFGLIDKSGHAKKSLFLNKVIGSHLMLIDWSRN